MLAVTCARALSWYWQLLVFLALAVALCCIGFCTWRHAYPWWLGLLLTLWLIIYTYQGLVLLCWRRKAHAIIALTLHGTEHVEVLCRNGVYYQGKLCPGGLMLPAIALLQVHIPAFKFKQRVLLEARHMSQQDYRALARIVRETSHLGVSKV